MSDSPHQTLRILRRREVEQRTGLGTSAIYDRLNPKSPRHDPGFPKPVRLGCTTAVGWVEAEISEWIKRQIALRDETPPSRHKARRQPTPLELAEQT